MTLVKRNGHQPMLTPNIWDDFLDTDLFDRGNNFPKVGSNVPAVNIKEKPDKFLVEVAAPGMQKKDFKIEVDGSSLTISSEKKEEHEEKDEDYNRKEFSYQSFYRNFHLPKDVVNADKIKAKYDNGILMLEIPKMEPGKMRHSKMIEIQ
ncbi:MAG TPA: Hsp20/alpha crystallin family protein [Hanamia sp.]|nr:Hsp20/alpha crystallin family protein [Hanamia sp.]